MVNFAGRLKELRKDKSITQKQMAELFAINERTYRRYESGEIEPPVSNMVQLAKFFDVSLDYLVGESNDPARH